MVEGKRLKKEKKNKNGKASVQKSTCVTDRDLIDLHPEEEPCVQADEKAGKKKKKERNVSEPLFNARNDEDISKTKKKKKKKQHGDNESEAPISEIKEDGNKKKKSKKSARADLHEEIDDEEEELPKKTKKKRNKETEDWINGEKKNAADKKTCDATDEKVSKKHKKSTKDLIQKESSEETVDIEGVKKNKKVPTSENNKKVKTMKRGMKVSLAEIKDDVKKKEKPAKSDDINVEKEKKKKARKASCADVEEPQLRKKKKSKKHSAEQDEAEPQLVNYEEQQNEDLAGTDRKNRKRKMGSAMVEAPVENPCSENGTKVKKKKKKIKEEVEDQNELSQGDVEVLSVKNGNTDEVTINQERRQALQMEIDLASRPQKPANPSGLGQWSTVQFDSSEKQQKFLRLMGGFKKGFQPAVGTTTRANMALGTEGQQQLQQKLLDEFDRAHSRRLDSNNRGAGIGFTAPTNKKFFIDINASRSVRFDD